MFDTIHYITNFSLLLSAGMMLLYNNDLPLSAVTNTIAAYIRLLLQFPPTCIAQQSKASENPCHKVRFKCNLKCINILSLSLRVVKLQQWASKWKSQQKIPHFPGFFTYQTIVKIERKDTIKIGLKNEQNGELWAVNKIVIALKL